MKGDLNVHGVTTDVGLHGTFEGKGKDCWSGEPVAFQAKTSINREDWGMRFNMPVEGGGVLSGRRLILSVTSKQSKRASREVDTAQRREVVGLVGPILPDVTDAGQMVAGAGTTSCPICYSDRDRSTLT